MKIIVSKDEVYFELIVEVRYYQIRGALIIPLRFCEFFHKLTPILLVKSQTLDKFN